MSLAHPFQDAPDWDNRIVVDICPELKWVRLPLPMSLDHINCYLIKDGDGWCIVDTGMKQKSSEDHWQRIVEEELNGTPITRVIVTHQHYDHAGMAGWLCRQYKAPLYMSLAEYMIVKAFSQMPANDNLETYWHTQEYFLHSGIDPQVMDMMKKWREEKAKEEKVDTSPLPSSFIRMKDGESLKIGEHDWLLIGTGGHAPEHISLYCKDLDLYISGDQVLPQITSNVSVMPTEPEANPLEDWIVGLNRIKELLPDSLLVLPAHELPFKGLHERVNSLVAHHDERMDILLKACAESPKHAFELTSILFDKKLEPMQFFLATGECLAHLHCLYERGQLKREMLEDKLVYSTK